MAQAEVECNPRISMKAKMASTLDLQELGCTGLVFTSRTIQNILTNTRTGRVMEPTKCSPASSSLVTRLMILRTQHTYAFLL